MKGLLTNILLFLFSFTLLFPKISVNAATNITSGTSSLSITEWVIDDANNTIAAVSNPGKRLLFFNATTLQQDASIALPGLPTDIIQDGDKIYIALDSINQILEYDIKTKAKTNTYFTKSDPYSIVKNDSIIYYAERDQWCDVFAFDLTNNTETQLATGTVYYPDLAFNKEKKLLYIGESGSSGSSLMYYSLSENQIVSNDNYKNGYGFPYSNRKVLFDGSQVVYANRGFDTVDATKITGKYPLSGSDESIVALEADMLITSNGFYNKDTYTKIGTFKDSINLATIKNKSLYTYSEKTKALKKYTSDVNITSSNIISIVQGTKAIGLEGDITGTKLSKEVTRLDLKSVMTDYVVDTDNKYIYAISNSNRGLFFIKEDTLTIEKSINLPSNPTDIIQDGDKIYVAISDINQIFEYDAKTLEKTATFYTPNDPYSIVKKGSKIYYGQEDQWCYIYEYDITTQSEVKLNIGSVYYPDLAFNSDKSILYIGESGSSGSDLYYYSLSQNKVISQSNYDGGYGFPYPPRKVVADNDSVYYAGRRFSNTDATRIIGEYSSGARIINVSDNYVFTNKEIYNKESYDVFDTFDTTVDIVNLTANNNYYIYSAASNSLLRIEPDVTAPIVPGVKNGGIYIAPVTITFDEGNATLNGKAFSNGTKVTALGDYVLEVIDEASNKTTIKFTIKAPDKEDINKDGLVNALDLSLVATSYNMLSSDINWNPSLDLNNDSIIDIYDLTKVSKKLQ